MREPRHLFGCTDLGCLLQHSHGEATTDGGSHQNGNLHHAHTAEAAHKDPRHAASTPRPRRPRHRDRAALATESGLSRGQHKTPRAGWAPSSRPETSSWSLMGVRRWSRSQLQGDYYYPSLQLRLVSCARLPRPLRRRRYRALRPSELQQHFLRRRCAQHANRLRIDGLVAESLERAQQRAPG